LIKAVLKQTGAGAWSWKLVLKRRPPKGRYTLIVKAVDGNRNVATTLASGHSSFRIGK
jgi:hypothetical protein